LRVLDRQIPGDVAAERVAGQIDRVEAVVVIKARAGQSKSGQVEPDDVNVGAGGSHTWAPSNIRMMDRRSTREGRAVRRTSRAALSGPEGREAIRFMRTACR
jgi:hypothetical protein